MPPKYPARAPIIKPIGMEIRETIAPTVIATLAPKTTPMKKKTSTSILNSKSLPIIKIISTEDEVFTKLDLEMEDSTHDMLVKWGKEVATDEDYIEIAIRAGLEEYIDSLEES